MNEAVIEMQGVCVAGGTKGKILDIPRLVVRQGELVAIVGPNGAGKSTFLQTVNLLQPWNGLIRLFGQMANADNATELRRRCSLVFQEALLLRGSVFENVALPLKLRNRNEHENLVRAALADFHCLHLLDRQARTLSGGEAQRVCLARALVTQPELLLLDEPFTALDAATQLELMEVIRQLAGQRGITVLMVTHKFSDVLRFADRSLVLFDGKVVQDASPEQLMRRPNCAAVARLTGVDNVFSCHVETVSRGYRVICLENGFRFPVVGALPGDIAACCIPGDMLRIASEECYAEPAEVRVIGRVERLLSEFGYLRIVVDAGGLKWIALVPRTDQTAAILLRQEITLVFSSRHVHLV